jgi:hypothetical protein
MNRATDALVAALPYDEMEALEISGDEWSWRLSNVLATEKNFNEAEYLAANPDVAPAVAAGVFTSGWSHFDLYGQREGRRETLKTWKSYQAIHYPERLIPLRPGTLFVVVRPLWL